MDTVRIQLHHAYQPHSNPYEPAEVEKALSHVKSLGLPERGWDNEPVPGVIRHETGPEIVAALSALAGLIGAIVELIKLTRKARPETHVTIKVDQPEDIEKVLSVLGK